MKIVVISGYFAAPYNLHKGYQTYCKKAKELGDYVIAIHANENQIINKYGNKTKSFDMPVDENIVSIDKDSTVSETLREIKKKYSNDEVIFFKSGGEYNENNLPEIGVENIKFVFDDSPKEASSSEIMKLRKKEKVWQK